MTEELLNYLEVAVMAFLVNVVPAFAPPTWMMLSLYHIDHPLLNALLVSLFGVIGSVAGRFVMYHYSKAFARFMPARYAENLTWFRRFVERRKLGLFLGTTIFSLGPLPSNFLFIASGLSKAEIMPVLGGFAVGRTISYVSLVYASVRIFSFLELLTGHYTKQIVNVLGVLAGISVIFVDWKKLCRNYNANSTDDPKSHR